MAQSFVHCTVCGYEFPRGGVGCPRCGHPGPESRTVRSARKRRNAGKCVLGVLIMIAGAFSFRLAIPFPINLVVAFTTVIIGAAMASLWECGHCRGHVDRDAVECPRCATRFSLM